MDLSFIERAVLSYLQKHPEVIEKVIHALLDKLVARLNDGQ
jgi:hypothetical protein